MDAEAIEKEAHAAALVQVAQMFQRPDQLEKLESLQKRVDRKKAAVEAMLRTGVQSQLEGIRSAISHLQTTVEDIKAVEIDLQSVHDILLRFPQLKENMSKLREANATHSQYAIVVEHLKHVYAINEIIEQTHEYIVEGNLLLAHKNIMELEHARDDMMLEIHRLQSGNADYEKNLLKTYFSDVEKLVNELGKQIFYVCSRCLEAARGTDQGPTQLVTALRIIEREERIDNYYKEKFPSSKFMPPGRPREWRKKCFEVIESTVRQRIEGNQLEDRTLNKQWLARYLEVCRLVLVEDLTVARGGAVQCFPPSYDIYECFVNMYHKCISARLREIASEKLEKNELVQILSWIQAYGGETILGNPRLHINAAAMLIDFPLLPKSTIAQLYDQFVDITRNDMREWLEKTLTQEKDDWYKHVQPEEESSGYYYTQLPSILFGMVEDTVSLTREFSTDIIPNIINVSIDEFLLFAGRYKDAAVAFKTKYFQDRNYFTKFTATMIAVANNLDICVDSTDKLKKHIRLTMEKDITSNNGLSEAKEATESLQQQKSLIICSASRQELLDKIDHLKKRLKLGMQFAITALLEEITQDIMPHLAEILTKKWLTGSSAVETICMTIADYYMDYKHLRSHICCALMVEIQYRVIGEFIIAIDNRRISFSSYEERSEAARLLNVNAEQIERVFSRLLDQNEVSFVDLTVILNAMADVLNLRDKSLLALEVTSFVRKFPAISVEILSGLLQMREDVGRSEARTMAEETINSTKFHPKDDGTFTKLFQMCKSDTKRTFAIEETMQNMFGFSSLMSKN
uniref:Exocyst complex component Sec6 n=1 Tax=Syphacia muris TaxID=451379 RepID=A0A0N5AZF8_9BILA